MIRCLGVVTGGLPGSRLLARLAISVSDDTVLRLVKLSVAVESHDDAIRCLGVDDWLGDKGKTMGRSWWI